MNLSNLKDQAQQMMPDVDKETLMRLVREPMRQRSRTSEFFTGAALLIAGIAIGLTAGMLSAPQSGRKTRHELRNSSKRVKRDALKSARSAAPSPN